MPDQEKFAFGKEKKIPGVDSIERYEFEPIKGYPILNWKGKRPFRSTQFYPSQLKEQYGEPVKGWVNEIYWGDNLQVMSHLLKKYRGQIQLVYIDPPFDSNADYKKKIKIKGDRIENDLNAFEEKQYKDIWTNDEYLQFMYERIILIRELMCDRALIYLHCDPKRNYLLRSILDEVFGQENFCNEVVWKRSGVHASTIGFGPVHDTIYVYSKSVDYVWNPQFVEYDQEYIDSWFSKIDEAGRKYGLVICSAPGERKGTEAHYEWKKLYPPPGRHWAYKKEKMEDFERQGLIEYSQNGVPYIRKYLDESSGLPVNDIWTDTGHIKSNSKENRNYPTQKPEALLERIIHASSNPGDIVFDCFMGSGTAQVSAMKLGRRFIGADINLGAVQTATKGLIQVAAELKEQAQNEGTENVLSKLKAVREAKAKYGEESDPLPSSEVENRIETYYTSFAVYNVNHYDIFRNPVQAKELLIEALEIQPLPANSIFDGEKEGRMVKIMPINRIATRADLNELIAGFDYRTFEKRKMENPNKPVERLLLVCMGHEPDLKGHLIQEMKKYHYEIDVEVADILRDKANLEFKRDAETKVVVKNGNLVIEQFYPMNLLQKLSLLKENVEKWEELVESVMIDWNYDGAVLEPDMVDIPNENEFVKGVYSVPEDAGTIRIKITDLLSESLEVEIAHG